MTEKVDCMLSFAEVAQIIGLDDTTIRNGECGTDELLRIKVGRRTVFSFNDVQEWIARRKKDARNQQQQSHDAMNKASAKLRLLRRPALNKAEITKALKSRAPT
jgi:hypothetical protein